MRIMILIWIFLGLLLTGCDGGKPAAPDLSSPPKAVETYYNALFNGDMSQAYNLIWERDRWFLLEGDFKAHYKLNAFGYPNYVAHKYGYEFLALVQSGENAVVAAQITAPDFTAINAILGERLLDASLPPLSDAELVQMLERQNWQLEQYEVSHELKEYEGRWYIYFDLETQEKERRLLRRAAALLDSVKLGDLSDAHAYYAEALELNPQSQAAQTGLALAETKINAAEAKLDYINQKMRLYDFAVTNFNNAKTGQLTPGVSFKLFNGGDRILLRAWVQITFLNAGGSLVSREIFSVPAITDEEPKADLLQPGAVITFEETAFYMGASAGGRRTPGWRGGSAKAEIVDIEFWEEPER